MDWHRMMDATTLVAAGIAGVFTLLRRGMLSGRHEVWYSARWWVQAALSAQAIFQCYVSILIFFNAHHVNSVEMICFLMSAGVSFVMAFNLDQYGRRPEYTRQINGTGALTASRARARPRTFRDEGPSRPPPN